MLHSSLPPTQFVLYADDGYDSHVVRLLLEEKRLAYQMRLLHDDRPEELAELNPYLSLPVLVNRDVSLYETNIIFEYLEERHQAYKLLPTTPKERANVRLLAWRLQRDWLALGKTLWTHPDSFDEKKAAHAKKTLSDSLTTLAPLFARHEYFMSDEFGWCDVLLLPLLWRLPKLGVTLPATLCRPLLEYQERGFARQAFKNSLAPAPMLDDDEI
ncbi:starvation protein A [Moraxella caviae]|uniref:Starvation protein A n=1 Tax=Moraxella caviae TaxID=34060 RepID=A0A1T0A671_9GAMM|nr:glutathione S-transferase N-terminal domain-containing protein [Moraxella caviae]OOR91079.1 starvation protein A [Moraxella caviae]STZ14226.1 Stringent starvation protein A [Moraxella caviae]VEW13162.1 Stringent starvation protein A [Moraxella caviae]